MRDRSRFVARRVKEGGKRRRWKRWVFGLPLSLILPFLVLVRLSTWLYLAKGMNGWLAIAGASVVAALLMAIVVVVVARRIGARPGRWILWTTGLMIGVYAMYLLLYISAANVKSTDLRSTYHHLHPVLRLSVSSFIVLDRNAVITDTERTPDDYQRMGLSVNETSLHYEQQDGYVHAVDLRTNGRTRGRNALTQWYFEGMGFSTLRHTGTADHLHVSIPLR